MLTYSAKPAVRPIGPISIFAFGINTFKRLIRFIAIDGAYHSNAPTDLTQIGYGASQHATLTNRLPRPHLGFHVFFAAVSVFLLTIKVSSADPLPVRQVADGVFAFEGEVAAMTRENRGAIANVGFVIGTSAVAIVDTGGSIEEGRRLLEAVRQRTALPVRYVILTHMHPDHVFGTAAFLGPDVAFVAHAHLNAALEARFDHYLAANRPAMGDDLLQGVVRVPATRSITGEETIDLGGRFLRLKAWPSAHTDNDLTVYDEATRTLFAGDLVFLDHAPSLDGSLRGWQRALDGLKAIPALRVIPGHGPVPAPWPDAIEPERRYFNVLAEDLKRSIAAGESLGKAVETAGRSEADHWRLFDDFNARNATAGFAELEWE